MNLHTLSDLEQDAITEVFNIGICKAGASLSEMVGKEVTLSIPTLSITTIEQANKDITTTRKRVSGVKECFDGSVAGNAILLFPENKSLELIKMLFPMEMPEEALLEMEQETLTEIGNIILNACLSTLSNIMQEEIINQIPQAFKGNLDEMMLCNELESTAETYVLKMDMSMIVKESEIQGDISFLIIIKSIDTFRQKLANYFGLQLS